MNNFISMWARKSKSIRDGVFNLEIEENGLDICYTINRDKEVIAEVNLNLLNKYIYIEDCYSYKYDYSGKCSLDCNMLLFLKDEYNAVNTYDIIKKKVTEVYTKAQDNSFVDDMLSSLSTERVVFEGDNVYSINGTCFEVQVGADTAKRVYIIIEGVYLYCVKVIWKNSY